MAPTHVLVPFDGSPLAADALTHALETYECDVTVLNVVTPIDRSMSEGGVLERVSDRRDSARQRVEAEIETATPQPTSTDRTVRPAVEDGTPSEAVLEYVASHEVDHVVMGGHGRDEHDLVGELLGTVATRVVTEAPVPVTVIR